MSEIYNNLPLSDGIKKRFEIINKEVSTFLDAESKVSINDEISSEEINNFLNFEDGDKNQSKRLTNGHILYTILNGGLVHANNDQVVQQYKEWVSQPYLTSILWNEFIDILVKFTVCVFEIESLNNEALEELSKN
ncbi:MAG TPA: hypothetical protein VK203_04910 [Nostocaceae cyanobacterium]|nr:hypothetical protein [Nostocaceae cyanobacterium]